jgi:hypothetical protein
MDPVIGTGSGPPYPRKCCVGSGQYAVMTRRMRVLTLEDSFPGRSWCPLGSGTACCRPILAALDTVLFLCRLLAGRTPASIRIASLTGRTWHPERMPIVEAPALKPVDPSPLDRCFHYRQIVVGSLALGPKRVAGMRMRIYCRRCTTGQLGMYETVCG